MVWVQVVVFYPGCKEWPERFYHGRVVSVDSPNAYWNGEPLLQRNTRVSFDTDDCSHEVRAVTAVFAACVCVR